jgi:cytochrome c-type biogenesis protein CcmH/NrfG
VANDLRQAIVRHPRDFELHQTLGDAYVHNDQLQEALEIYNAAEELLR